MPPRCDSKAIQDILKFYNENDSENLAKVLEGTGEKNLITAIDSEILRTSENENCTEIIKAIFFGCNAKCIELLSIELNVLKHCLKLLINQDVSTKVCTEIVGLIILQIDHIHNSKLPEVADELVNYVKQGTIGNGYVLHVLPKLIGNIQQEETVISSNGSLTGFGYKKQLINKICSLKWSTKCSLVLIETLKDVELDADEQSFIIQKVLRQIKTLNLQEIPPLVYQLLNISTNKYDEILYGLTDVFDEKLKKIENSESIEADCDDEDDIQMDSIDKTELAMVEGTVLLHITNVAKLNINLAKSVIKRLKLEKESFTNISNFFIACCISLCNVKRCADEIITHLKGLVLKCHQAQQKQDSSKWLHVREAKVFGIQKCLIDIVDSSKNGWDHLAYGLVQLGFSLMETFGPKPAAFGRQVQEFQIQSSTPQQKSCDTGIKILALTFKVHHMTRVTIIERIFKKIMSDGSTAPISHFISVLHGICKKYASIMLETKSKIKSFLEHLHYISPVNAKGVLRAIIPIVRINANLKDSLILLLRKMLFYNDENSRVIAVNGFVLLLQTFQVMGQMSLSQASSQSTQSIFTISSQVLLDGASSSFGSQGASNEPLCLEVLSTLRRCLTQQCSVREALYNGIWNVVRKNKGLGAPSLEILLGHFSQFYEPDEDSIPPVNVEKCVKMKNDVPFMLDNIPLLISSILQSRNALIELGNAEIDPDILDESINEKIMETFKSLATRLTSCEIEDFELDKSADFNVKTNMGKRNGLVAEQVIGLYEIAIEFIFLNETIDEEVANKIIKLFHNLKHAKQLVQHRKDLSSTTMFTPVFLQKFLAMMTTEISVSDGLSFLKNDEDLPEFMFNQALISCVKAESQGFMCGISGRNKNTQHVSIMKIAASCLKVFNKECNDDEKSYSAICLKIFKTCLQFTFTRNPLEAHEFLKETLIVDEDGENNFTSEENDNVVGKHLQYFQKIVTAFVENEEVSPNNKLIFSLIETLSVIASAYAGISDNNITTMNTDTMYSSTPSPSMLSEMNEWLGKFCSKCEIEDVNSCKTLLQLHFDVVTLVGPWQSADKSTKGCECVLRDICKDIKKECGYIDEEDDSQNSQEHDESGKFYQLISKSYIQHIVPLVTQQLTSIINETEYVLQRLKGQINVHITNQKYLNFEKSEDEENSFNEKRRRMESSICPRLATVLMAYQSLIRSALPIGGLIENVLKGLTQLFKVLRQFSKYYIWILSQSVAKTPPSRYENLVKMVGSEISQYVYAFINHIDAQQQARTDKSASRLQKAETGEKARIIRETRGIPPMIFAIEEFEHNVIQLGKKCKLNLMSGHRLPTSRDFRIKNDIIKDITSRQNANDEDEEDSDDEEDGEEPAAKISRV